MFLITVIIFLLLYLRTCAWFGPKKKEEKKEGKLVGASLVEGRCCICVFLSESFPEVRIVILNVLVKPAVAEAIKTQLGDEICSDCTVHVQSKSGRRETHFLQVLNATESTTLLPNSFPPLPKSALRRPPSLFCCSL